MLEWVPVQVRGSARELLEIGHGVRPGSVETEFGRIVDRYPFGRINRCLSKMQSLGPERVRSCFEQR